MEAEFVWTGFHIKFGKEGVLDCEVVALRGWPGAVGTWNGLIGGLVVGLMVLLKCWLVGKVAACSGSSSLPGADWYAFTPVLE